MQDDLIHPSKMSALQQGILKHAKWLLTVLMLLILATLGFLYWTHHQKVLLGQASTHYMMMLQSHHQQDLVTAQSKANTLVEDYPKTSYASLASLLLAQQAVQAEDFAQAQTHLWRVIQSAPVKDFQFLALTRLARILIAQDKPEQAVKLLDMTLPMGSYRSAWHEIKGDIFLQADNLAEARSAYLAASEAAEHYQTERPILKMKLEDLGATDLN
jgi:predicted negative regulator of RcsB-dependent stress response